MSKVTFGNNNNNILKLEDNLTPEYVEGYDLPLLSGVIGALGGNDILTCGNQFNSHYNPANSYHLYGGTGNDAYYLAKNSFAVIADCYGDNDTLALPYSSFEFNYYFYYGSYAQKINDAHFFAHFGTIDFEIIDAFSAKGHIENVQLSDGVVLNFDDILNISYVDQLGFILPAPEGAILDREKLFTMESNTTGDFDLGYSTFFNEDMYLANKAAVSGVSYARMGSGIAAAGMTPLQHFIQYGAFEVNANGEIGINPSANFDVNEYFEQKLAKAHRSGYVDMTMAEVVQSFQNSGLDPIAHYTLYGQSEGLTPTGEGFYAVPEAGYTERFQAYYFNEDQYLANKTAAANAAAGEGVWTTASMKAVIAEAGMTLWQHFSWHGAFEINANGEMGIDPSSKFDVSEYYADKAAQTGGVYTPEQIAEIFQNSGLDPITHYAMFGYDEALQPEATGVQVMGVYNVDDVVIDAA